MYVRKMELRNFRNYGALSIEFDKKLNLLMGDNAQGKTNIIEALRFCSMGRSFRTRKDEELILFGEDIARINLVLVKGDDEPSHPEKTYESTVEIALARNAKAFKIDGRKLKKSSELLSLFYTVVFTPEDLRIVKDGPERRRSFLDLELCQLRKSYYSDLSDFRRCLLQRNRLIKEEGIFGIEGLRAAGIEVWDESLAEYALRVMKARKDFIGRLSEISRRIHYDITEGREKLELYYEPDFNIEKEDTLSFDMSGLDNLKKSFIKRLKEGYERDIKLKTTSLGPQRDDIKLIVNGVDIRKFGSQGQQRTAALSLKLSELEIIKEESGEDAVLLLDDVLSELDSSRQEYLIKSLGSSQLFITSAELSAELREKLPSGRLFHISKGNIVRTE